VNIIAFLRKFRLQRALAAYQRRPGCKQTVRLARAYLKVGRVREALDLTTAARHEFPGDQALLEVHEATKRLQARAMLSQACRAVEAEATPENYGRVTDLYRTVGDFDNAFRYAEEALSRYPDHWGVHESLGKLHYYRFTASRMADDCRTALEHFLRSRELLPGNYSTQILLAITALRLEDTELARVVLEEILDEHPDDTRAQQLLAHAGRLERLAVTRRGRGGVGESGGSGLLPDLSEVGEGTVALFLYDSGGDLLECAAAPNETFRFSDDGEAVESLLDTCFLESERMGMGELTSWHAFGEGWQIALHTDEGLKLFSFHEGSVDPVQVERRCKAILEGSPVT
jgi:tetratricopeptide (TPR) repeat protein